MDFVIILSIILGMFLVVLLLTWIFLPAITSHRKLCNETENNILSDSNGVIATENQIFGEAKFDLSLIVPAYNEVILLQLLID